MKQLPLNYQPANQPHYSSGVVHDGMVYVSGQLAVDEKGQLIEGGIREHTLQALKNMRSVLKMAGTDIDHVVRCRVYTSDLSYWGEINEVYSQFFGETKPARTVVPTKEMHYGSLVEIEATAYI